jgi:succinate dehydrogenase / fumarate reductase, membrane anchor subunit
MDGGGSKHGAHCDRVDHKQRLGGIELMNKESMRSPLGLALGLGSARDGVEHWRLQRVTAIALVPLTVWFAASLMARAGNDYAAFIAWLRMPFATILVVLLLTTLFYHTALGLQVVMRGLRPLRNENSSAVVGALWLLCSGRRRHLRDPRVAFGV